MYLNEAAGRVVADAVSRGVVRMELAKHAEREELKWQVGSGQDTRAWVHAAAARVATTCCKLRVCVNPAAI